MSLYWFANVAYEYLWVSVLYALVYHWGHIFMRDHARILKVAFNVDLRYFDYNNESTSRGKHETMHTLAAVVTGTLLAINPVVHSMIFFWFRFMDITQLNRLAIYTAFLRLARVVNIMDRRDPHLVRPLGPTDGFLIFQLLYTSINFWNPNMFIPTLFYLLDEFWEIPQISRELYAVHNVLLGRDDRFSSALLNLNATLAAKRLLIGLLHMSSLMVFILLAIVYSEFATMSEVVFFFGAAGRVAFMVAYSKDPEKLH